MQFTWLSALQPQLLALVRIVTALLFLEEATVKLFDFPSSPEMPRPLPPLIKVGSVIEFVTGILIAIGLFTRLAAFIASGEMAVAYFMLLFPKSFWPSINKGQAAVLYSFIFLYVAATGGGAWSIDALIG